MSGHLPAGLPPKQGLYDPANEHDSCGVGFVAHIKGRRSHQIVRDADEMLKRMNHRGACGCEPNTGDGAGMLTALPHGFLRKVAERDLHAALPEPGQFAAGLVFLPRIAAEQAKCKRVVEQIIAEQGQRLVGWRKVPTDAAAADVGPSARACEPHIEQLFVAAAGGLTGDAFERQLYLIRKRASRVLRGDPSLTQGKLFYVCSLSTKVLIYKGMLTPPQLTAYYPDLHDPDYESHLAMIHSRFSTNTFPSWDRAQPNRFMSHNGEINTLRGNMNWMLAREGVFRSKLFGDELKKLFPVVEPDCSDSGTFDNVLEFLLMTGRTLQEAVMMMIPEAWQKHETMPENRRAFYEYHSCLMEPWDGPASVVFTDGRYIGAVLDRNGLRPSRYYLTHDDLVIMASEVGVVPLEPQRVAAKDRLQPGRMLLVDFEQGRLIPDDELKYDFSNRRPYVGWLRKGRLRLSDLEHRGPVPGLDAGTLLERMQALGYTTETVQFMLLPIVQQQRDPVGSMGNDSALACLSDQPRLLYDYFKQLFAQVTNPPIDSIREEVIMSLECYIGPERNILDAGDRHCERLLIPHPILSNDELAALKQMDHRGWRSKTIDITFPLDDGPGRTADRAGADLPRGRGGDRRGVQPDHPFRPGDLEPAGAGQCPAGLRGRAPSPGPPRRAHAAGDRDRDGRGPGGTPPLPAGRLRRGRHQSLPGLRSVVAGSPRRLAGRRRIPQRRAGADRLPRGGGQGHAQGDGQDGDLDPAVLQGGADLRGGGPEPGGDRPVLRRHGQPGAGGGPADPGRRVAPPPCPGVSDRRPGSPARAAESRASSTGGRKASGTPGIPSPLPTCRWPRGAATGTPTGGSRNTSTASPRGAAPSAACSASGGRTASRPCRWRRSSRPPRSSGGSAPAR